MQVPRMEVFEHVAVAYSIVLSLGVVRLLDGLRPALLPDRRYWVHVVWLVQKLLNLGFYWWGFWSLRDGVDWTIASFLWILLVPSLLFLQATALATTAPDDVRSWRAHFFEIRRWFFAVDAAVILHAAVTSTVIRGIPLWHPYRGLQAAGLVISVLGVASASPRLHAALGPAALGLQTLGLGWLLFRP